MIELLTFVFALEKNQISMRAAGLSAPEHVFRLAVEIIKWKYAIGLTYKGEENKIRSLWKNAIPFILWFGESQVSNRRRLPISGKQCSIFGLTRAKVIRVARSNCMRKWVCLPSQRSSHNYLRRNRVNRDRTWIAHMLCTSSNARTSTTPIAV